MQAFIAANKISWGFGAILAEQKRGFVGRDFERSRKDFLPERDDLSMCF